MPSVVQLPIASTMSTRLLKVKEANCTATKGYGAVNTRCTVTGENTLRTMTLWSSQELLEANVDTIRGLATAASGMTPTSGMKGSLLVELD